MIRIAQISPLHEAVPPKLYGGTERIVHWLTEELVRLGHEVTLFASGDSQTTANLEPMWPKALRLDKTVSDSTALNTVMFEKIRRSSANFDIIHNHLDYLPFPVLLRQTTPMLTTVHSSMEASELHEVYNFFNNAPLVSISNSQRKPIPYANWVRTIYHGMPKDLLTPLKTKPKYLAFLGRITPIKGVVDAINIALKTGIPLKIAAKIEDYKYYFEVVKPLIDGKNIEYIGEIGEKEKSEFLSNAVALLFPIHWSEPFGLVMIEAMACGTPTIAYKRGSTSEIITDDLTGFVVLNEKRAIAAVKKIDKLDRGTIRREFESKFTAEKMALNYVAEYNNLVS